MGVKPLLPLPPIQGLELLLERALLDMALLDGELSVELATDELLLRELLLGGGAGTDEDDELFGEEFRLDEDTEIELCVEDVCELEMLCVDDEAGVAGVLASAELLWRLELLFTAGFELCCLSSSTAEPPQAVSINVKLRVKNTVFINFPIVFVYLPKPARM